MAVLENTTLTKNKTILVFSSPIAGFIKNSAEFRPQFICGGLGKF